MRKEKFIKLKLEIQIKIVWVCIWLVLYFVKMYILNFPLGDEINMDLEFKLRSLYICVKNMERAIEFYEDLLGQKVTEKNDIYSV